MKKKLAILVTSVIIISLAAGVNAAGVYKAVTAYTATKPVLINGFNVNDWQYPALNYKPDGAQYPYIYIPTAILKNLGMTVGYDDKTEIVSVTNPNQSEIQKLKEENERLKAENQRLMIERWELDAWGSDVGAMSLNSKMKSLEEEVAALTAERDTLQRKLTGYETSGQQWLAEKPELLSKIAELENQVEKLNQDLQKAEEQKQYLSTMLSEAGKNFTERIGELEAKIADLEAQLEEYQQPGNSSN